MKASTENTLINRKIMGHYLMTYVTQPYTGKVTYGRFLFKSKQKHLGETIRRIENEVRGSNDFSITTSLTKLTKAEYKSFTIINS